MKTTDYRIKPRKKCATKVSKPAPTFIIHRVSCEDKDEVIEQNMRIKKRIDEGYRICVIDKVTERIVGVHKNQITADDFINFNDITKHTYISVPIQNILFTIKNWRNRNKFKEN